MNKVLFTATVQSHIKAFHTPFLKWFQEQGYETHVACSCMTGYESNKKQISVNIPYCDVYHNIPFERSPFSLQNFRAYHLLKDIIDCESFKLIHCHTPVGGAITRLAAKEARKNGTKLIYTAHGFHFYKGASLKNWILFYPIEKKLARDTDCLITINEEDYALSTSKHFPSGLIKKIHGVGVDLSKFKPCCQKEKEILRKSLNYNEDDFILLYVAELSLRKNHFALIEIANLLKNKIPNLKILLAGTGLLNNTYQELVKKNGLENIISFLGFRSDIDHLLAISDVVISTSKQEGLPVNLLEAMASGKPILATNVRGNCDLIEHNKNGFLFYNTKEAASYIEVFYKNPNLCQTFSSTSQELIQPYALPNVLKEYDDVYKRFLI